MIDKDATLAVATDATNVWHQRFGHLEEHTDYHEHVEVYVKGR